MRGLATALLTIAAFAASPAIGAAAEGDWTIGKVSGEVWLAGGDNVQQASLKQDDVLKAGDTIRTGRSGRVLLKRGEETILVAANSVVGLPLQKKEGLATTIVQQAGSILLDVEKKNVKHFEVETPYAAAVVKGTQFRVTVEAGKTQVDVTRGQVEVANLKTGKIAQVMAGQHATAFSTGKSGLSLSGAGTLHPIEQGKPRAPSVDRIPVPRNGFAAPRQAGIERGHQSSALRTSDGRPAGSRISATIGDVKLNVSRVTHGLARDTGASANNGSRDRGTTNWSSTDVSGSANGQGSNSAGVGMGNTPASVSAVIAASSGANDKGPGKGKGNDSNGKGNGGANGNGKPPGHGNGNGNNGNGNGNSGNGNGNGRGRH